MIETKSRLSNLIDRYELRIKSATEILTAMKTVMATEDTLYDWSLIAEMIEDMESRLPVDESPLSADDILSILENSD